jgi:tetratricopeptide (TPR) repeat protein/peroxiredoxin
MRLPWTVAWLGLILPLTGVAAGTPRCNAEDPLRALLREYEVACQGNANRNPDGPLPEFLGRFLAFARAHPGSPDACAALGWIIGHGPDGPHAVAAVNGRPEASAAVEAAIEILSQDHARDAAVGPICPDVAYHVRSKAAEDLLRRVIERSPGREARGLACLSLARYLVALSESGLQRRLNPSTGGFLDRPLVKRLRDSDPEAMSREAEMLLSRVIDQYADVEYLGGRLGDFARGERGELLTHSIGREAPEIIGEDIDGKPMKLSDYRGKVVVLNFSSHEYCGICRTYYPFERALVERLKDRPFALLGVESDDHIEAVRKARDKGEITWRSWWDGGSTEGPIVTRWNVKGWPAIFIIDHKGVIRYKGLVTDAMAMGVDALLKEQEKGNAPSSSAPECGQDEPVPPDTTGFKQAIQAAEAISNEVERAAVLSHIAAARARAEGEAAARPIFHRSLELARGSIAAAKDDRSRGHLLVRLALIQLEAGDRAAAGQSLKQAIQSAERIEQAASRHDLMQFIGHIQGEAGDVAGGRLTAIACGPQRVGVLADLAVGQAKAGDTSGALATLKSVGSEDDESVHWAAARVLPEVALAQARSSDWNAAKRTTDRALAAFDRTRKELRDPKNLARIALAQAKAEDREGSRATFARALRDADDAEDFPAAEFLARLARAQCETGDEAAARKSLNEATGRIAGRGHNPDVDDLLTQAFLDLGDLDKALETARNAHNDQGGLSLSPDIVRQLARAESRSGDASRALGWVTKETSPVLRAYALLGVLEEPRSSKR